jgi:hypothetical protein
MMSTNRAAKAKLTAPAGAPAGRFYVTGKGRKTVIHDRISGARQRVAMARAQSFMELFEALTRPASQEPQKPPVAGPTTKASNSKMPDHVREYPPKFEGDHASMSRRFFPDENKWGYSVKIGRKTIGRLICRSAQDWNLITDAIKPSVHRNPLAAFIRVTGSLARQMSQKRRS